MQAHATRKFFNSRAKEDTLPGQIYFSVMMMYLDPGLREIHYSQFALRMTDFMQSVGDPRAVAACVDISKDVMSGAYYRALRKCKALAEFDSEPAHAISA